MKRIIQVIFTFIMMFCVSGPALAEDEGMPQAVFGLGGAQAFTSQILGDFSSNGGFGGFRYDVWGMFMELQYVGWMGYSKLEKSSQGSLNVGIGSEWLYFDYRIRTVVSAGSRAMFKSLLKTSRSYLSVEDKTFNMPSRIFVDYYGMVDVRLNATAYYFGMAAHQLADSFSHGLYIYRRRRNQ